MEEPQRERRARACSAVPMFYMPANAPPEIYGVLARALLKAPDHKLALLPAGEARIEAGGQRPCAGPSGTRKLKQYRIIGPRLHAQTVWLDADGNTCGGVSGWFSVVPKGSRPRFAAASRAGQSGYRTVVASIAQGAGAHAERRSAHSQRAPVRSARSYRHAGHAACS